ncbi:MAG: response regulator [Prochlorotrichaceae cyanobacterium]|jgi:PAS domain S-box-containing protein
MYANLSNQPTILIVDDHPTNLEILYPILSKAGWGVRVEVEGLQALHQVHQNPPDLILLDIMLPGLDGFNVCQQLKADAKTADIPVIFMTALTDTADKLKGFSLGAVDYITKPFQQEEVLARVKLHLESQHMAKLLHSQNTQLQRLMLELETRVEERTRALKESEAQLQQQLAAIESAIDGIAILDVQQHYIYVNQSHLSLFGYQQAQDLLGKTWHCLYSPQEVKRFQTYIFPQLTECGHWQGEAIAQRQDGTVFEEEVSLTLIEGIGMICVCRDISDRKRAEVALQQSLHEKELLLKEIHHRVKNNLLVVSSLLELQAEHISDLKAIQGFEDSQNRIRSMALVHEKLYKSKNLASVNMKEYLTELVEYLCNAFDAQHRNIEMELDLSPIFLNIETVTPCGLIVSEIVSNIFKHAFLGKSGGKFWLSAHQNDEKVIDIMVRDNGVGFPDGFNLHSSDSLGLNLIILLTKQLRGKIQYRYEGGSLFQLVFQELKYKGRL